MEKHFKLIVKKPYFDNQLQKALSKGEKITVDHERAKVLLDTGWLKIKSIKRGG